MNESKPEPNTEPQVTAEQVAEEYGVSLDRAEFMAAIMNGDVISDVIADD